MKITKLLSLGAIALLGAASFSGAAHALPTFAGGSLAIQATTSTTASLQSTSSFAMSSPVNLVSGAGDFSGLSALNVFGATTLLLSDGTTFDFAADGIGSFTANSGPVLILTNANNGVLSFFVAGTYEVGADFANAGAIFSGDETYSLTQTNGDGAISISGTFQSPEVPPSIPEPMTLSLLGAGLIGLGVMRRRAK